MDYDDIDKQIMMMIQGDMPLTSRPFSGLAQELKISEDDIVGRITGLMEKGIIRRMAAVLRHQKAGFNYNAMVAWQISENDADHAGEFMAAIPQITHCYWRKVPEDFPYPLFSMIHAENEIELNEIVDYVFQHTNIKDYIIIKSVEELKKASMVYFE